LEKELSFIEKFNTFYPRLLCGKSISNPQPLGIFSLPFHPSGAKKRSEDFVKLSATAKECIWKD